MAAYERILLKLSGEALGGQKGQGIDDHVLESICRVIGKCLEKGTQTAVVVGGGNYFRGRSNAGMDRCRADQIGMLGTMMNALCIGDRLDQLGIPNVVMSSIAMEPLAQHYHYQDGRSALAAGKAVILGGGTGSPFFSTDTAAALRGAELEVQAIFKASTVDGVYNKDPKKYPDAVRYEVMGFHQVLEGRLGVVMDAAAAALCQENKIQLCVFSMDDPENILRAVEGEQIGTVIKEEHWT